MSSHQHRQKCCRQTHISFAHLHNLVHRHRVFPIASAQLCHRPTSVPCVALAAIFQLITNPRPCVAIDSTWCPCAAAVAQRGHWWLLPGLQRQPAADDARRGPDLHQLRAHRPRAAPARGRAARGRDACGCRVTRAAFGTLWPSRISRARSGCVTGTRDKRKRLSCISRGADGPERSELGGREDASKRVCTAHAFEYMPTSAL